MKKIVLIFLILFSTSLKSETLVPLEDILEEDNPKNLSYVLLRCASLHLALSYLPRDSVLEKPEDVFLGNSTISVELFNTVTEAHASNTGMDIRDAKKFVGKHLFDTAYIYLEEMKTIGMDGFSDTIYKNDRNACFELIMRLGISTNKYFN